ncbi:uncharacterized protein BKA78DRAFT_128425 [Phyllosticta capitalensis]|uniref:uncharacterized protein n=1 Tax=Phyllosticta capitalensis TaxID=121624 RepID=UPI00312EB7E8
MVPWRMTKKGRLGHLGAKNKTGTATDPHTKMEAMPRHHDDGTIQLFHQPVIQESFSPNSSPTSVSKKSGSCQTCHQPSWISDVFSWKCPLSWNQPVSRKTPKGLASALLPKFGDISFDALVAFPLPENPGHAG